MHYKRQTTKGKEKYNALQWYSIPKNQKKPPKKTSRPIIKGKRCWAVQVKDEKRRKEGKQLREEKGREEEDVDDAL